MPGNGVTLQAVDARTLRARARGILVPQVLIQRVAARGHAVPLTAYVGAFLYGGCRGGSGDGAEEGDARDGGKLHLEWTGSWW